VYAKDDRRHVLMDFGTTALPKHLNATPAKHMPRVAEHIRQVCGGQLTAVIATHRHADHISGFATDGKSGGSGKIIAACKPRVVLQPWTEDPDAARDAKVPTRDSNRSRKSFVTGLDSMHRVAQYATLVANTPPPSMTVAAAKQLRFLGEDNIKNRSAVENLIAMGRRRGAKAVFGYHGADSGLVGEGLLEGVKVHLLGPPTLAQTEKIRKMRSSDPDQFWQLLGGAGLRGPRTVATDPAVARRTVRLPVEARWFRQRMARLSTEQLLEIVRRLDDAMNNTSLIVLFEVGGKKLLFPGDAQIENWSWALEDAPDAARTRALLADVDFYKVGHHGSRNATPRKLLWDAFANRGKGMHAAISTLKGKHGDTRRRTEVPRRTLLEALQRDTHLTNTEDHRPGTDGEPCGPPLTLKV
jgi:hypothetical protein